MTGLWPRLQRWMRRAEATADSNTPPPDDGGRFFGWLFDVEEPAYVTAHRRGMRLLIENLTPQQRRTFERRRYFVVQGGDTGRLYRIREGRQLNIDELDALHRTACVWCFHPADALVLGDVLLTQKIALETFEEEALRIAYRHPPRWHY